jgi:hypothetical protein
MSAKPILEFDGKHVLSYFLGKSEVSKMLPELKICRISFMDSLPDAVFREQELLHPWLLTTKHK